MERLEKRLEGNYSNIATKFGYTIIQSNSDNKQLPRKYVFSCISNEVKALPIKYIVSC